MNLIEKIYYLYFDYSLVEMANVKTEESGLHRIVQVSHKGGAKHGPRVKVSNIAGKFDKDDNFTVTAENEPNIVGKVKISNDHVKDIIDWIKLNKDHIHKVWHSKPTDMMSS